MPDKREVAGRILHYLVEHPDAQDTLEGVAHWWLLQQKIEETLDQVEAALDELAADDLVIAEERSMAKVYRLNPEKLQTIQRRLSNSTDSE